ncbi:MAG: hypothetical protein RLZ12_867 [Bacillota bacterium]|jgi:oligoendopeptidase F
MLEQTKKNPLRTELPIEVTWRLEDIFGTDDLWEDEFKKVTNLIPTLQEFKGKLAESAVNLLQALTKEEDISERVDKLYTYARMRYDQDLTNSYYQQLNERAATLYVQVEEQLAYLIPEILALAEGVVYAYFQQESGLYKYRQALQVILSQKEHYLSCKEEQLLAQAGNIMRTAEEVFSALNNADLSFGKVLDSAGNKLEVTHGRYTLLLEHKDRKVRRDVFNALYAQYARHQNTFACTLAGAIKQHNFIAKVRGFNDARHAALKANNIPEEVYDQLIAVTAANTKQLQEYLRLRKKVLKLQELGPYDLNVTLVPNTNYKITFDEAEEIVREALKPLGEEYGAILDKAFRDRWIDLYENKGKRSGAYSSGSYGTNPYILMNWQDNLDSLFTLVHELGHSLHSYYSHKYQPYVYGNYSIFVAEVASTCNEALLHHYLLHHEPNKEKQKYILQHYLDGFRGTVYRQVMFAEFEYLIHRNEQEGEPLTADSLSKAYLEILTKNFGDGLCLDNKLALEWARIPHFYYNFYVYQYATGYSAAASLAQKILGGGAAEVTSYLRFLKAGSSDYPLEVLKRAGIDMTQQEPLADAFHTFAENLNKFEKMF